MFMNCVLQNENEAQTDIFSITTLKSKHMSVNGNEYNIVAY